MGNRIKNVIYILTNQQYPGYVKIGYASDLFDRLNTLNTGALIGFQVYGVLETDVKNADLQIHNIIQLLNPLLRAKDLSGDKERSKEFFKLEASEAFELLRTIASVFGLEDKVYRVINGRKDKPRYDTAMPASNNIVIHQAHHPTSYSIHTVHSSGYNNRFTTYADFLYNLCKCCIKEYSLDLFQSVVFNQTSSFYEKGYFCTKQEDGFYYLKLADNLYLKMVVSSEDVYALELTNLLCDVFDNVTYELNY